MRIKSCFEQREVYIKKYRLPIIKLFVSDDLPYEVRVLNYICFLGVIASVAACAVRIVEGMPVATTFVMVIIMCSVTALLYMSATRAALVPTLTVVIVYGLGLVLWPAVFFSNGGANPGMAAYFAMIIMIDFLLLKGAARAAALIAACVVIVLCYCATIFWGLGATPEHGLSYSQILVDNIQSILISGFFTGLVITFQKKVYLNEKNKAEAATVELRRNDELLTLVNKSATSLLTTDPEKFIDALSANMAEMANCMDIDRICIWKADTINGAPVYRLLFSRQSPNKRVYAHPHTDTQTRAMDGQDGTCVVRSEVIPAVAAWGRPFGERKYVAETAASFTEDARFFSDNGVQALMAFPVYLHDEFWGFVAYISEHGDTLCTENEAVILQSSSLLMVNAVERNENLLQLNRRLKQQQLMSGISKSFISKEPMRKLIIAALEQMGTFLNVVRVLIAVFEKDSDISHPEYYWICDPKYKPCSSQKGFSGVLRRLFPSYMDSSYEVKSIYCDNTISYEGGQFQSFYELAGIESFICSPIYVEGELWGVMSIEEHERFRQWNESDAQLISTVTSAISSAVARDVMDKERGEAYERALQASRAKGDFLSNMSHEMRTPMNAIIGMTAIGKASETIEKKNYAFDKIDDASNHLLGVINDILDMSKIEANKLELSHVSFNYEKLLKNVVNVINFRVDERRQKLYVNIDKEIPHTLIGDDQRLAQVITNLLSNAVKFTPEEGIIHLDSRLLSEADGICRLQIEVTDTGIGITDEQKARLFQSFEQAEVGTSRKFGGTGLGLTISKRIVELMDGGIWVDSEPGKGSKFAFTVSLKRDSVKHESPLAEGVHWNDIRILAVDDESEIREFFTSFSKNLGIACDVAGDAEKAIELVSAGGNAYNVYCIDYKLPGMSGIELTRYIREHSDGKSMFVLISSSDWITIEDEARAAGVDRFLPKPLFQSSIVDLINESIGVVNACDRETDGKGIFGKGVKAHGGAKVHGGGEKAHGGGAKAHSGAKIHGGVKAHGGTASGYAGDDAGANADTDTDADAYAYADVNAYADSDMDSDAYADMDSDSDSDAYADMDMYSDSDSDSDSDDFDFSGHAILLAEDVEINREIVISLLEHTKLLIECAENGVQALDMFKADPEKYDMIFMDVQMPEMDGYEATKRIRALDCFRSHDIPVVAMTANVFREDIERCLEAGMDGHIGKPIKIDEVISVLRKYLMKV